MQWIIVTTEPINDGQLQWDKLCVKRVGFWFGGTDLATGAEAMSFLLGQP
jgi:hypothetical protein